ncbi:MAG: DotU family type IV/VI secretion system protein [Burkholderiaceae bacterium]|jgi:type VI secretion system protein ImpK|nr:DotU family type IV/VI secretion system protein [Burkholderiaceae bacterium]
MHVFKAYLPLVAFAALFRDDSSLHQTDFAVVRADAESLLEGAHSATSAYRENQSALLDDAALAACAFVDEALLSVDWAGRAQWEAHPLQWVHFSENNAGEVFYRRLQDIIAWHVPVTGAAALPVAVRGFWARLFRREPPPKRETLAKKEPVVTTARQVKADNEPVAVQSVRHEVLGVFAICLTLGFKGKHHGEQDRKALHGIALDCLQGSLIGKMADQGKWIMPEAYYMPASASRRSVSALAWAWFWIVLPAVITIGIYGFYDTILITHLEDWLRIVRGGQ